jgi:sporulation protein YhbH
MVMKIEQDHSRFRHIVKGTIRKNLKKYVSQTEMIGRKGKELISIPVPQIDLPHFKYGHEDVGGVGQGEGEEGTPLGSGDQDGGTGEAGDQPGDHMLEVEISIEELAEILGEELELPKIEPRGKKNIVSDKGRYTGIRRVGPESLRHFKRTYREALKRQIISGTYQPERPVIIPIRKDKRYRSWKETAQPESSAVIIYMMDVSGSMGQEQKDLVRIESFWIETWLQSQYDGLQIRYIIHDATAREVDKETFYHTRESGGTVISTAYELCNNIIHQEYNPDDWNIYPFHFSDGDNWSGGDTARCLKLMKEILLPISNQFSYGQVKSHYGSGQFIKDLRQHLSEEENLVTSEINSKEDILTSIKDFLGKGR